jgi:GntR family transcriptional repressor for pyruvate dehydrogenase complex
VVKLEPIDTQERLYVRVARRISDLLSSGEVSPGDKLPSERDLAEMLKVSRPSVREAMIALEVSGLIEVRIGSGTYVADKTRQQPAVVVDEGIGPFEILEIRLLIEPEACALAAERISDDQLQQLGNTYDEMRRTSGTMEMETFDSQFHKLIAEATENTAIARTISWLWALRDQSELSRGFHRLIIEEGVYPVLDEHEVILKALENRDAVAAKKAMLKHLEASTASAAQHFSN